MNAGGRLNATKIDLSYVGNGGSPFNRVLTLNGGTLANIAGGNLTVDSTTFVTLTGSGNFDASAGYSITISGVAGARTVTYAP